MTSRVSVAGKQEHIRHGLVCVCVLFGDLHVFSTFGSKEQQGRTHSGEKNGEKQKEHIGCQAPSLVRLRNSPGPPPPGAWASAAAARRERPAPPGRGAAGSAPAASDMEPVQSESGAVWGGTAVGHKSRCPPQGFL